MVELIVVIVILAILATIGFLNFKDYPKQARDTTRMSDFTNIRKAMDIYYLQHGTYPTPTNTKESTTYTGWLEGEFDEEISGKIGISKIVDPQTKKNYTYLISEDKSGYSLQTEKEMGGELKLGDGAKNCNDILNIKTNLGETPIDGNYTIVQDGKPLNVFCDMTTDGGGWTLTHLLKHDTLPAENTEAGYKGLFTTTKDYGEGGFTTDITNFPFTDFIYETNDDKTKIETIDDTSGYFTAGHRNEGFDEWVKAYIDGKHPSEKPRGIWNYYTDKNFRNKESISVLKRENTTVIEGWRSMDTERLLCGSNGFSFINCWQGTNMPFGKRTLGWAWCVGGKNDCWLLSTVKNGNSWASLWLR